MKIGKTKQKYVYELFLFNSAFRWHWKIMCREKQKIFNQKIKIKIKIAAYDITKPNHNEFNDIESKAIDNNIQLKESRASKKRKEKKYCYYLTQSIC